MGGAANTNIILQEAHVNSCYKHFYFFVMEFKLMESKEFEPLVSSCHSDCNLNPYSHSNT